MSEEAKTKGRGKKQVSELEEILVKFPRKKDVDDDITKIFDDEIKLLAKQARAKMLKKLILEKEKEISELDNILKKAREREVEAPPMKNDNIDIDLKVAAELAKLPEDERKKIIQTYTMLKMADREASNPNLLIPLLIGFSRENRGASQNEMFQWAKMHLDALKTGYDLGKEGKQPTDATGMFKLMLDTFSKMIEADREARRKEFELLIKKIEELKSPGLIDSIVLDENVRNALKELGFFRPPQPSGVDPRIQLEIEKLKMMHEQQLKKMEMEFQLKLKELETEMYKSNLMLQGLRQIGHAAATALGEELLSESATEASQTTQETPSKKLVTLKCPKCKGDITFPEDAEVVVCPHCGGRFKVKRENEGEA